MKGISKCKSNIESCQCFNLPSIWDTAEVLSISKALMMNLLSLSDKNKHDVNITLKLASHSHLNPFNKIVFLTYFITFFPPGPGWGTHRYFEAFSRLPADVETSGPSWIPSQTRRIPQNGQRQKLEIPARALRPTRSTRTTFLSSRGQGLPVAHSPGLDQGQSGGCPAERGVGSHRNHPHVAVVRKSRIGAKPVVEPCRAVGRRWALGAPADFRLLLPEGVWRCKPGPRQGHQWSSASDAGPGLGQCAQCQAGGGQGGLSDQSNK